MLIATHFTRAPETAWSDDISKWPNNEFGDIYNYLIDLKGPYRKESLKAYISLEEYNYYASGHVRTVYYFESSEQSMHVALKAQVNLILNELYCRLIWH